MKIAEKVRVFMEKKDFQGIVLKKVQRQIGWAGCQEEIQGEFLKADEIQKYLKKKNETYEDINGIKVFIPADIKSTDKLIIDSQFSFFGIMKLKIS